MKVPRNLLLISVLVVAFLRFPLLCPLIGFLCWVLYRVPLFATMVSVPVLQFSLQILFHDFGSTVLVLGFHFGWVPIRFFSCFLMGFHFWVSMSSSFNGYLCWTPLLVPLLCSFFGFLYFFYLYDVYEFFFLYNDEYVTIIYILKYCLF